MTQPTASLNAVNWFEIPCTDLGRAQAFYEAVLGRPMRTGQHDPEAVAIFSYGQPATGGCLVEGRTVAPGAGVRIYLDCEPGVQAALNRVAAAGGQVIDPCIDLPEGMGVIAHIRDTEGNTIGLHAQTC